VWSIGMPGGPDDTISTSSLGGTELARADSISLRPHLPDGKMVEVTFTVESPDAFYQPWSGKRRYRRIQEQMVEDVCAENNQHLFDYHTPIADKPDF
jgi:hypothetical protein